MANAESTSKILIADDDPDIREIMVTAASTVEKTQIISAKDGKEASQYIEQEAFDLLILDVMMPHCSGLEICKKFKSSNEGKLTPVLIVTARDSIQDKVEALADGADDYITKPFNFMELKARIKALLRVREMNLVLKNKNLELQEMQNKLVEQQRQLAVTQLAGAAAHALGQPLSAILLNLHLIKALKQSDQQWLQVFDAVQLDLKRTISMVEQLKTSRADSQVEYYDDLSILELLPGPK